MVKRKQSDHEESLTIKDDKKKKNGKGNEIMMTTTKTTVTFLHNNNNNNNIPPPLEIAPHKEDNTEPIGQRRQKVIVLLDKAKLETVKTRSGAHELLNCDDHRDVCRKWKMDPAEYRPDICHQELLALFDSPLNKSGNLKVYVKTTKNVLIDIDPSIRMPRTFKRFAGLVVQLLHKMKIKAAPGTGTGTGGSNVLMKVIKNPFSQYLPPGTRVYGMSCKGTLYSPQAMARALLPNDDDDDDEEEAGDGGEAASSSSPPSPPICFVIGAMATGSIQLDEHPYIEKMVSVSSYPLSGASAISRILSGIEEHLGIV